jgi:hypothetical protein
MINKKNTITDSELLFLKKYINDVYTLHKNNLIIWKYPAGKNTKERYSNGSATYVYLPILKNDELTNFIKEKTECSVSDITSIHIGKYEEGDFLENHIDERLVNSNNKLNAITLIFLINPAEIGGLLFLDGIDIELNNSGDYIIFDGQKTYHEVTKVEKGTREVLIVWLIEKDKNLKKII